MSLSSTYLSRKALIADNLQSMGVLSADADEGLTTLANKILDIEPSISGLDLDTSITIHSSDTSCLIGQSIMFWAELKADYDDETATDVDLSGVLTGATIEFKNGNTVLGSAVTDSDGIAYYTHTFNTGGIYNITASFAGTENFDDCVSTSITVSVAYEMSITADKSILSYNDHEYATITANLSDGTTGISGETLSYEILDKNDNVLDSGSDVTDASGDIIFTYQSTGIGDVQVIVYYGMFLQETFVLSDRLIYDVTEYSRTGTGSATSVPTNSKTWNNTGNWVFEADVKVTGNKCRIDIVPPSQSLNYHLGMGKQSVGSTVTIYVGKNGGGEYSAVCNESITNNVYYPFKIVKEGTTIKYYWNDVLQHTDTTYAQSWIGNYIEESAKFTTWGTEKIYIKNISVKAL